MIHDKARVEAIRSRAAAQIALIDSLKGKIVKGNLDALDVAHNMAEDVESFFLADLDRKDRSPAEEAYWLSGAERVLQIWAPYLEKTEQQFAQYGGHGIQIVGGS